MQAPRGMLLDDEEQGPGALAIGAGAGSGVASKLRFDVLLGELSLSMDAIL